MTAAKRSTKHISCKQCSEFIDLQKNENVGKCLRDGMYKDTKADKCEYGSYKR